MSTRVRDPFSCFIMQRAQVPPPSLPLAASRGSPCPSLPLPGSPGPGPSLAPPALPSGPRARRGSTVGPGPFQTPPCVTPQPPPCPDTPTSAAQSSLSGCLPSVALAVSLRPPWWESCDYLQRRCSAVLAGAYGTPMGGAPGEPGSADALHGDGGCQCVFSPFVIFLALVVGN